MVSRAPRRRHSAAVYRRRRLALFLVLLVVAAVVWLLMAQPWKTAAAERDATPRPSATSTISLTNSSPSPVATTTPKPEATAPPAAGASEPTPTAEPSPTYTPPVQPCRASNLAVQAVTDRDSYASGENPQLSITLLNNSRTDCTLNVGTSTQKFTVKSGSDVWWRSTDCQTEPSDMIVLLTAGQSVTSAIPVTWDRTRSSVDSCTATDRPRAPGGGASYHLSVEIGGVVAPQSKQILLY